VRTIDPQERFWTPRRAARLGRCFLPSCVDWILENPFGGSFSSLVFGLVQVILEVRRIDPSNYG
jgi:hypothetical protein